MPQFERFDLNNFEQMHEATIHALEKGRAIERAQEKGSMDIVIGSSKREICHIGIIVDTSGKSIHLVNAVTGSKIALEDAIKTPEYPDIIVQGKNFNLETILKKFSEYLFLKLQLQDIKINAYNDVKSFKDQEPVGILDPLSGTIEITA